MKLFAVAVLVMMCPLCGCGEKTLSGKGGAATGAALALEDNGPQSLIIRGQIDAQLLEDAKAKFAAMPELRRVQLRSPGGEVISAMELGREIYKRKLDVIVDGPCASSCANYLFIAGAQKSVVEGGALLMHGGSSFRPETTYAAFPKTTAREVAMRHLNKGERVPTPGDAPHNAAAQAVLKKLAGYRQSLHKNEMTEVQYFNDMRVRLDLIDYSGIVSSCHGTSILESKITLQNGPSPAEPIVRIDGRSTAESPIGMIWSPPREDWEAVGVKNIVEFWRPSAASQLLNELKSFRKARVNMKSIREVNEAECIE
jgi:hypothetical protein